MKNRKTSPPTKLEKLPIYNKIYPFFFTIIFVSLLNQYPFSFLEATFYDLRIKLDFNAKNCDDVVIITMDEISDEFLGESYPYTYATHHRFIKKLINDQPKTISFLLNLYGADDKNEIKEMYSFKGQIHQYTNAGGLFRFGTEMNAWGEQLPPRSLRGLGHSLAVLHPDNNIFSKDDVVRRLILGHSGELSLHLWTANHFKQSKDGKWPSLHQIFGSYYLEEADAHFALFRFSSSPKDTHLKFKKLPYHKVLTGNFPKGFFKNKIVLIGPQYLSKASDYILTPFDQKESKGSPKINVHASIIQSLINELTVWQLPRSLINFFSILLAIILSYIISRVHPTKGLLVTLSILFFVIFFSLILFFYFNIWIYLSPIIITIFIVYYIWVPFRAISEYQTRYAIQQESKLLKKVDQMKHNFISLMGHDLKTPVAKIANLSDILLNQHPNNEVQKKHLISIRDSTKELNQFISTILELTKVESKNITLNLVSKDVNQIIKQVIQQLRHEANLNDMNIITSLSPLYPIHLDINLTIRLLSNLLENAIKYAGKGSHITLTTWDDNDWVYIDITDNGIGISENGLKQIFKKFYRIQDSTKNAIKGTGLGLYLVKYFVELQGGNIKASSKKGEGTTFVVKFKNS